MRFMSESVDICIDVWGDFAMFTRPDSKVERVTYNFPTPSACRGILNAIYSKPMEFYYEITQIDIMKPIRTISVKKNEVTAVADANNTESGYCIDTSIDHTQRTSTYLCDVYYRIHAKLIRRKDAPECVNIESLEKQFHRRVSHGKCFFQPALGVRECICNFSEPDMSMRPIQEDCDFGITLYDVFDITKNTPLDTRKKTRNLCTLISFFDAKMRQGVIKVPAWDSDELFIKR